MASSVISRFHHPHHVLLRTCGILFNAIPSQALRSQCVLIKLTKRTSKVNNQIRPHFGPRHFSTQSTNSLWSSHNSQISTQARYSVPVMDEEVYVPMPKEVHQMSNIGEMEGWISVGSYNVFAWSVSGVESSIVVKSEDVLVAFDLGIAVPESVKAANVFITHGHIDHVGAVSSHVAKRGLTGMRPARYFVPPHMVEHLTAVTKAHHAMAQTVDALDKVKVIPIQEGDSVRLNSRFFVKSFPTQHRVPSQGYILYKEEKKLKKEFHGLEGFEVAALHREGKEIHDTIITPEVAYTGDSMFDVFTNPPTPDLLKVKVLISEATFLDDYQGKSLVEKARERGHMHLSEYAQNAALFQDVGHIILVHFSQRYPCKYITDAIRDKLPPELRCKVTPATVAKATTPVTYNMRS